MATTCLDLCWNTCKSSGEDQAEEVNRAIMACVFNVVPLLRRHAVLAGISTGSLLKILKQRQRGHFACR